MRFWFHYNKPASRRAGKPVISLHFQRKCHLVGNVECRVPLAGRIRKTQPAFVMAGLAKSIRIEDGVAIIE